MAIEPLSKEELAKQERVKNLVSNPDFPDEWKVKAKGMTESVDSGFKYYRRQKGDKVYMLLRKGNHDFGLGLQSEEKEGKLFAFFPQLETYGSIPRPAPWVPTSTAGATPQRHSFLSVPINRVAIIPRDYVPSISVIRYFQITKENGFEGDFSQFINDVVTRHFASCHGIILPVLLEEEIEVKEEEEPRQQQRPSR